jgi:secreted trypsin-like serine protease
MAFESSRLTIAAIFAVSALTYEMAIAQEVIKPVDRRIVGGEKADIKDHPWQVALDIQISGKTYLCGGSIIADRWVLTAAHCLTESMRPREVRVKAGVTDYVHEGIWSDVKKIVVHADYNPKTHEHDLALIKLRSAPKGRVIPMATGSSNLVVGTPLEVTGWGAAAEGGDASRLLLKASVPYAGNAACNEPTAYNGEITPGMMCAGYRDGGIDSCQGDSGGPLVWHSPDGVVLVGVVSWGEGCARRLKYGVYTRVDHYRQWIEKIIGLDVN